MSYRFTSYASNTPPGCGPYDSDPPDMHECQECGRLVHESEVDPDASEAFSSTCIECAERARVGEV